MHGIGIEIENNSWVSFRLLVGKMGGNPKLKIDVSSDTLHNIERPPLFHRATGNMATTRFLKFHS